MNRLGKRLLTGGVATVAGAVALGITLVAPSSASDPNATLAQVRAATADFHDLDAAGNAGYQEFLPCFDDPSGGMGQHFAKFSLIDGTVDALHPEVLVYEPRPDGFKLVAVEYVVPGSPSDTPPTLFGKQYHYNPDLQIWFLHAWIWRPNPLGMFKDYNPKVRNCP